MIYTPASILPTTSLASLNLGSSANYWLRSWHRSVSCIAISECGVACIILCARTASELNEVELSIKKVNARVKVCKYVADVVNEREVIAIAEAVRKEVRLDVLVKNAGMSNKWESITEGDTETYLKTWDLHIKGTYIMLKSFLPLLMEAAKNFDISVDVINTTSGPAHFVMPGASAYNISKFALMRLSEFAVAEYGNQSVNCVSLSPGRVMTGINKDLGPWVQAGKP
jgi:NADP-dependent 3-hydroxy acid dehydrogenase YdfG